MKPVRAVTAVRAIAVPLMLAALFLRALIPPGYMPNPQGVAGGHPIVICTGHGPLLPANGPDGKPLKPGGHGDSSDICVFAAAATLAPAAAPPALDLPQANEIAVAISTLHLIAVVPTRHRPQSSRGPPLFA